MKVFIGILIFLAVITVITLIRAIFWVPKKKTYEPLEDEEVQLNEYRRNLSDAIKFKTVSQPDPKDEMRLSLKPYLSLTRRMLIGTSLKNFINFLRSASRLFTRI